MHRDTANGKFSHDVTMTSRHWADIKHFKTAMKGLNYLYWMVALNAETIICQNYQNKHFFMRDDLINHIKPFITVLKCLMSAQYRDVIVTSWLNLPFAALYASIK